MACPGHFRQRDQCQHHRAAEKQQTVDSQIQPHSNDPSKEEREDRGGEKAQSGQYFLSRGRKAADDRLFLEAMHFFTVENVRWRALPERFGHWNSVWKRFDRLSKAGVFEAFFDTLAEMSASAHLIQMFDSTIVRAHISAAGAKGGSKARRSDARVAGSRPKSTPRRTIRATSSRSI